MWYGPLSNGPGLRAKLLNHSERRGLPSECRSLWILFGVCWSLAYFEVKWSTRIHSQRLDCTFWCFEIIASNTRRPPPPHDNQQIHVEPIFARYSLLFTASFHGRKGEIGSDGECGILLPPKLCSILHALWMWLPFR